MSGNRSFWLSPQGIAAMASIAAVSYFLLMEHWVHKIQYLPFLILLLCPLMHIFMHGGHGKHDHGSSDEKILLTRKARRSVMRAIIWSIWMIIAKAIKMP